MCESNDICGVSVSLMLWNTFDLSTDRRELQQIDGQPLVDVQVERISFTVSENSLEFDLPPLGVYVAPQTVMSPNAPEAQAIGTIPSIDAMTYPEDGDLTMTPDGYEPLAERMQDYETPFNIIVGSELIIHGGESVPRGRMVAVINATAEGETGL